MSEIVELASRLVAIDSVNPGLVPGGGGEAAAARVVAEWCDRRGFDVALVGGERPSVIARRRSAHAGRSLILNGHLDTVGVAGMDAPFEPRVEGGRLYGRGSFDMKGALAALLVAAAEADGDVIVTAVADEELASAGTETVLGYVTADAALVAEPTALQVAVAHRGFVGFEIATTGVAAHGSMPHLGEDAIRKMGPVLVALDELDARLQAGARHPLAGAGAIHASVIEGGQEMSSFPARCILLGERRTIPGETLRHVESELEAIAGGADVRIVAHRDPYEAAAGHPFVDVVLRAAGAAEPVGAPFWTDAALLAAAGIPTVVCGPDGEGAHAEVEWVDLDSLERLRDVVGRAAAEWTRS